MDDCLQGQCYYCGRELVCAVPLDKPKRQALIRGLLTCGPCVHVHGRLPWRKVERHGVGRTYTTQRQKMKKTEAR